MEWFTDITASEVTKTLFCLVAVWWLKTTMSEKTCKKHDTMLSKAEFKLWEVGNSKDFEILGNSLKHLSSKMDNHIQKAEDYQNDIVTHFKVARRKKRTVLIYDDEDSSIDLIKRKLLRCDEDLSFRVAKSFVNAKYELLYSNPDIIFSDLMHNRKPLGIDLCNFCKDQSIDIPFHLYSASDKPEEYTGSYFNKSIEIEKLKEYV